jgi:hypothetical protein
MNNRVWLRRLWHVSAALIGASAGAILAWVVAVGVLIFLFAHFVPD